MRTLRAAQIALVSLLGAAPLSAQSAPWGRLEGTIAGISAERRWRDLSVALVRLEPEPGASFTASADAAGQFRVDSVPAGRYLIELASPLLDSLALALPPAELRIDAGRTARADFTLPSAAALRDAVCPGQARGAGGAAVVGRATDADTERPLVGADVVAAWMEVSVDAATLKPASAERTAASTTGVRGEYRLCGVPAGSWLTVQLQHGGRASAALRLAVSDSDGVAVRHLSLSAGSSPTVAALDSAAEVDSATGELMLSGTAALSGTVRGAGELPLPNVQVRVRDARSAAVTDDAGRYLLGSLPAGTQILVVRHLGYALSETPVELRPGTRQLRDVELVRAVSLDSVRVTALRSQYREFEFNRGMNFHGKFITSEQIEHSDPEETGDLIMRMGGFTVVGRGKGAKVFTKASLMDDEACEVNVVVDGVQDLWVNSVAPRDIVGIEGYPRAPTFQSRYRDKCGLIVIWSKAHGRAAHRRAMAKASTARTAP